MKASIISIGSELLIGQIIDRNSSWISNRCFDLGISVTRHLSVDDINEEIFGALDWITPQCDLIFITGGLGPTSDDLTRSAVATWLGSELEFNDTSWQKIKTFFESVGRTTPDSNKQQCYFPKGARVLTNQAGTADGFLCQKGDKHIVVLPGPPREIAKIWSDHLSDYFQKSFKLSPSPICSWRTIGLGESKLVEILKPVTDTYSTLDISFRFHAPYVELKIIDNEKLSESIKDLLTRTLKDWLVETNEEDTISRFLNLIENRSNLTIYDSASYGYFGELLFQSARKRKLNNLNLIQSFDSIADPGSYLEEIFLLTDPTSENFAVAADFEKFEYAVGISDNGNNRITRHKLPYESKHLSQRNAQALSLIAPLRWLEMSEITLQ